MNKQMISALKCKVLMFSMLLFSNICIHAQYVDTGLPPAMINHMTQQFNQAIKDYEKYMEKFNDVSIMAVPYGENSFFLILGTVGNVNRKAVTLYTTRNGCKTSKPLTSYPCQLAYVVTPAEFLPGDKICIYYNDRIQKTEMIPSLESPQYHSFCQLRLMQAQNLVQMTMQNNIPNINPPTSGGQKYTKQSQCTTCNGRGWIQGSRTPTYGNTGEIYCRECGGYFLHSHSHDRCPTCQGRGYITKIQY